MIDRLICKSLCPNLNPGARLSELKRKLENGVGAPSAKNAKMDLEYGVKF